MSDETDETRSAAESEAVAGQEDNGAASPDGGGRAEEEKTEPEPDPDPLASHSTTIRTNRCRRSATSTTTLLG
jgi:hypothetical protein